MVFSILPHKFRAKANSQGPCGNRALHTHPSQTALLPTPHASALAGVGETPVQAWRCFSGGSLPGVAKAAIDQQ